MQECRLARARGPGDHREPAGVKARVEPVEDDGRAIALRDRSQFGHCAFRGRAHAAVYPRLRGDRKFLAGGRLDANVILHRA